MNSFELWDKIKNDNDIVVEDGFEYIFPKTEIKIKNYGVVSFLKRVGDNVTIECKDTKTLKMTDDHIMTLINGQDVKGRDLKLGDKIFDNYKISCLKNYKINDFSYDVTTSSAHFMANGLYSHNCRSFLAPIWEERRYPRSTKFYWQYVTSNNIQYEGAPGRNIDFNRKIEYSVLPHFDANCEIAINLRGNTGWLKEMTDEEVVVLQPIVYGRFNMGVVTINLPHCALSAVKSVKDNNMDSKYLKDEFYRILDERLEICHKALLTRWESVKNIKAKNSPILWQHGALARLNEEDTIGDWVMKHEPSFTSISLGYVGLYETCMALTGESNTSVKGQKTSSKILQYLNKKCEEWKEEDHLGYSIYGTPEEALTYKFASALAKDFGLIEHITDKEYIVNSYHVDPREDIDAFLKLNIEGQYLALSSGGAVSYIETPDMQRNPEAIISVIQYMHEHIMYAEVNTKLDTCYNCGYQGELKMIKTENGDFRFVCPVCGCDDPDKQLVTRRICGYMGVVNAGNVNKGRGDDIFNRTLHLDSESNIRYVGNMKQIPKSCLCS